MASNKKRAINDVYDTASTNEPAAEPVEPAESAAAAKRPKVYETLSPRAKWCIMVILESTFFLERLSELGRLVMSVTWKPSRKAIFKSRKFAPVKTVSFVEHLWCLPAAQQLERDLKVWSPWLGLPFPPRDTNQYTKRVLDLGTPIAKLPPAALRAAADTVRAMGLTPNYYSSPVSGTFFREAWRMAGTTGKFHALDYLVGQATTPYEAFSMPTGLLYEFTHWKAAADFDNKARSDRCYRWMVKQCENPCKLVTCRADSGRHHDEWIWAALSGACAATSLEHVKFLMQETNCPLWMPPALHNMYTDNLSVLANYSPGPKAEELVEFLLKHGSPVHAQLGIVTASTGKLAFLKKLYAWDVPMDQQTVHQAVTHGHWNMVKWLRTRDPPCWWWGEDRARAIVHFGTAEVATWG
jgi:hypothetical protein